MSKRAHLGSNEFATEMEEAGFTARERSNARLCAAALRLLIRGQLYTFDDDLEIEYGVSGPFNDDENRAGGNSDAN